MSRVRAISLLPITDKIIEEVLEEQIIEFAGSNGLLHDKHFEFRRQADTANPSSVTSIKDSTQSTTNRLSTNSTELKIQIHNSNRLDPVRFFCPVLEDVGNHGFLALTLDSELEYGCHVDRFCSDICKGLAIPSRLRSIC